MNEFSIFKVGSVITLGIVALVAFSSTFFTVESGQRALLVRAGSVSETVYSEGFHLKNPIDDAVYVDIKPQKVEMTVGAGTKDNQQVTARVTVNFAVNPANVKDVYSKYRSVEAMYENAIKSSIENAIKFATAQFTPNDLLVKREDVNVLIAKNLSEKVVKEGVIIGTVNANDFSFSKNYNDAIEEKVRAEQNALTAKNNLETAKFESEKKVIEANAEKDTKIAIAKGEAEAIRIQTEAIKATGGAEYLELKRIEVDRLKAEKWSGNLPTMVTNGTPLFNMK